VSRYVIQPITGLLVAVLATLVVAVATSAQTTSPVTLMIGAGVGSGAVAGNVYTPGEVTIHIDDSITWTIASDEPHSITFGPGPASVAAPNWPVAGFTPPPPAPPGPPRPMRLASVDYNGSAFVNSALLVKGSTATLRFTNAGEFDFYCVIHPGMSGVVHVVAAGQPTTDQTEADAMATATQSQLFARVDPVVKQTEAALASQKRSDGTKLWSIFTDAVSQVGPQPGGGSGYLEILHFIPASLVISVGDTVEWTATKPHTVTFAPPGQDFHTLGNPLTVAPARPSDSYDGKSLYNSGVLLFGPNAPSSFTLTFPTAGDFHYVCLLHADEGQLGLIQVTARNGQATLPATGGAPEALLVAVASLGAAMVVFGIIGLKRLARP
jgi:plastocyanin